MFPCRFTVTDTEKIVIETGSVIIKNGLVPAIVCCRVPFPNKKTRTRTYERTKNGVAIGGQAIVDSRENIVGTSGCSLSGTAILSTIEFAYGITAGGTATSSIQTIEPMNGIPLLGSLVHDAYYNRIIVDLSETQPGNAESNQITKLSFNQIPTDGWLEITINDEEGDLYEIDILGLQSFLDSLVGNNTNVT